MSDNSSKPGPLRGLTHRPGDLMDAFFCHNYTSNACHWDWAIVEFSFMAQDVARASAFGDKQRRVDDRTVKAPLEPGELIALSMPDETALFEIPRISYRSSPDDLYEADLKYVQHLTGTGIMDIAFDRAKRERSVAWAKLLATPDPSAPDT